MEKNNENKNLDYIEKNMDLFVMDEVDPKDKEIENIKEEYTDEYINDILKEVLDEDSNDANDEIGNKAQLEEENKSNEKTVEVSNDKDLSYKENEKSYDDIKQNITKILTDKLEEDSASYENIKTAVANSKISVLDLNSEDVKAEKVNNTKPQGGFNTQVFETKTITIGKEKRGNFKYEFHKNLSVYKINDYETISLNSEEFSKTLLDEINNFYYENSEDTANKEDKFENNIEKEINSNKFEYNSTQDAANVRKTLLKSLRLNFFRMCLSGVLFTVLFLISVFFRLNFFNNVLKANNFVYISINFACLILTCFVCSNITLNGLINMAKFKFNFYSGLVFAGLACFLQNIFAFLNPAIFASGQYIIFDLIVIFAYFSACIGEFLNSRRIIGNFNFISAKKSNYRTSCIYENERKAQELFKGLGNYQAQIAYQSNADFLTDFIRLSKSKSLFEISCDKLSLIGLIASLLIFTFYFVSSKNLMDSLSVLALSSCLSFPLTAGFIANKLMFDYCTKINKNQGMLIGYPAIKKFSQSNAILIDANVLYPNESVYLHKIKGAGPVSVDHVVLITAGILQKAKSPLLPIFSNVLKVKKDLIPYVDNVNYIDNLGLEAWVQGNKVLIGTREFMEENKVHIPNNETKELKKNRQITYIAFANELVCTMVTSYKPSAGLIQKMQGLEDQGVSFLIHSTDPNITPKSIANDFKIFFKSIKVISHNDYLEFESDTKHIKSAQAFTSFRGTVYSFASIILSCIRLKANITALTISQVFCFIICFCTISVLIFYSGIASLHLLEIFFYSLFWSAAVFAVSKVRK